MDRTDRIARLLTIPLLLIIGVLVFVEYRERSSPPDVTAEASDTSTTASPLSGFGASEPAEAGSSSTTTSSTPTSVPSTTTTAAPEVSLPAADPAAPPQEPAGIFSDGKVVLRGSVPDEEMAFRYQERAASVLGPENVTLEMTLDPRVTGETMSVEVQEQFRFPSGGVEFDPKFEALLNLGAAALQLLPEATLVVTGHTDDVGTPDTNLALSQARAQIVVDWMVQRGIAPERVVARGAGESEPIADNATPEGRDANRRIEAVVEGIRPAEG
ncbi:MAG: OmpA family protein [Actinomycetota bacterium]|nr:OmpA family protein [Actinomycetota bacterium]